MSTARTCRSGPVTGVIIGDVLYALGNVTGTSYRLQLDGQQPKQFLCLCGCCPPKRKGSVDWIIELEGHIADLVEKNKSAGIRKIVCRVNACRSPSALIAGLPVQDAADLHGAIPGGTIFRVRS